MVTRCSAEWRTVVHIADADERLALKSAGSGAERQGLAGVGSYEATRVA